MPVNPITNSEQVISINGKVFYNDKRRRIELKKPIRDLFHNSTDDVFYIMELCLSREKAIERIKELCEQQIFPVILYFSKEDNDEQMS